MFSAREYMSCGSGPSRRAIQATFSPAFTLVELLVSLVIISILASLSLAGLAAVRTRGKADKTRSTIRKLHEIIMPQYESYLDRRVNVNGTSPQQVAEKRLVKIRLLMAQEMPHSWSDVYNIDTDNGNLVDAANVPVSDVPAAARAYAAYKAELVRNASDTTWATKRDTFQTAECLAMIVFRGGFAHEAVENFRAEEIGDVDKDGAIEFIDGWGQPIAYIRWPAGYGSAIQSQYTPSEPDPFDPMGVSTKKIYPSQFPEQRDYALVPLIFSGGADGSYSAFGITTGTAVWTSLLASPSPPLTTRLEDASKMSGFRDDPDAAADNITNHDLNAR